MMTYDDTAWTMMVMGQARAGKYWLDAIAKKSLTKQQNLALIEGTFEHSSLFNHPSYEDV